MEDGPADYSGAVGTAASNPSAAPQPPASTTAAAPAAPAAAVTAPARAVSQSWPEEDGFPLHPPTYQLKPPDTEKFRPAEAKRVAEAVLSEALQGKRYEEAQAPELAPALAERVKQAIRAALRIPRYKVLVQVTLGEMREQGIRVVSRCLWDPATDSYASATFKNESLWCSAIVFAFYME